MYKTLTTYEVATALCGDEYANWSWDAAYALAEHLEDVESETDTEIQLDVVAIRCEWTELPKEDYGHFAADHKLDATTDVERWLALRTEAIRYSGGMIYLQF
jgi:hypothetical protein